MLSTNVTIAAVLALASCWPLQTSEWPLSTCWIEQEKALAAEEGGDYAEFVIDSRAEVERSLVLASDIIVVGRVESLEGEEVTIHHLRRTTIRTAITIDVEERVRGELSSRSLVTYLAGGTVGERTLTFSGISLPEVGKRYVFCLMEDPLKPGEFRGGYPETRFEIKDGRIVDKDMSVEAFISLLRQQTEPRRPSHMLEMADGVVAGTVSKFLFQYGVPQYLLGDAEQRNLMLLTVERVIKGDIESVEPLRIELPPAVSKAQDVPILEPGERVLVVLRSSSEGGWCLLDGRDSVLRVDKDGRVGGYASLDDFLAAAEDR